MEHQNDKEAFNYTYSAQQQEEIKNIRKKYLAPEEGKMEQLRKLDNSVMQKATTVSIIVGFIGVMLLGIGMCCTMVWEGIWFIPGIIVGVIGIAILCFAYPVYTRTLKKERDKIAPEILRLTEELME